MIKRTKRNNRKGKENIMKKILIIEAEDCKDRMNPSVHDVPHSYNHVAEADVVLAELPSSPDEFKRFKLLKHRELDTGGIIDLRYIGCLV